MPDQKTPKPGEGPILPAPVGEDGVVGAGRDGGAPRSPDKDPGKAKGGEHDLAHGNDLETP